MDPALSSYDSSIGGTSSDSSKTPDLTTAIAQTNPDKLSIPDHDNPAEDSDSTLTGPESTSPIFDPRFKKQIGEYPNEDLEWLINTRDQTPKQDVIQLKEEIILQRARAHRAEHRAEQSRAAASAAHAAHLTHLAQQSSALQKTITTTTTTTTTHHDNDADPPTLEPTTPPHYLYTNTLDRLRECTVHIALRRATRFHLLDDFIWAEHHAQRALALAAPLAYAPLSAWCHFHVGKAQHKQRKYEDAAEAFEMAAPAAGLYVGGGELAVRWGRAREARRRRWEGEASERSVESVPSEQSVWSGESWVSERTA